MIAVASLGSRMRAAREKKGWSQTFVCQKLGISNSALSGYERDYREPDAEMIATFADLYEVSTDYLMGMTDSDAGGGRAFYGGADQYTDEEKAIAEAAAKAAVDAYRQAMKKRQGE